MSELYLGRVRTGVMHDEDGWWILVVTDRPDGTQSRLVYGLGEDGKTPFPSEQAAEAKAREAAKLMREWRIAKGGRVLDGPSGARYDR